MPKKRMKIDFNIAPFVEGNEKEVLQLLAVAELPTEDLTTEKLQEFLVARRQDDTVIGTVGIEVHNDLGLLRSLVVHPLHRKRGLGKLLLNELESFTQKRGVTALYLLTITAADFFLGLGYQVTSREAVPTVIADSEEF